MTRSETRQRPWDQGFEYAQKSRSLPTANEFRHEWRLSARQSMLFWFGFMEGHGRPYPPHFRAKAEWLLRDNFDVADAIVLAVYEMDCREEDAFHVLAEAGFDKTRQATDFWVESLAFGQVMRRWKQ